MRVSIALCSYNGERFLEAQLRSILAQTRLPDEIVIGDDGSADGTLAIIDTVLHSSTVPYRVLAAGTTRGTTQNFERTIGACDGDVILLSDQDDVWQERRVARALEIFEDSPEIELIHSDARLIDEHGEPTGATLMATLTPTKRERLALSEGQLFDTFLRRNLATGATIAFRESLRVAASPMPPSWLHDEWLAILAASRGSARFFDETWIDYRIHSANQVGAHRASLRAKIAKVVGGRGARNAILADRSAVLWARLADLNTAHTILDSVALKQRFETARAELPTSRLMRFPAIARLWRDGGYARFASRGSADVLRDLLQSS